MNFEVGTMIAFSVLTSPSVTLLSISVLRCSLHNCLQVFFDKSNKQTEQTAEENKQLLASNNELKEQLSKKQQCLDDQQLLIEALTAQLSPHQVRV